jgi:hypothetical protein
LSAEITPFTEVGEESPFPEDLVYILQTAPRATEVSDLPLNLGPTNRRVEPPLLFSDLSHLADYLFTPHDHS